MSIWSREIETLPREEIVQIQSERLRESLNRVYRNVSYYKSLFESLGVVPEDIDGVGGLSRLPFTTREDLLANYPYGMFAVPLREIVRIHTTAGVSGKPVVVGYSRRDVRTWAELVARVMASAGVTPDDVLQISFAYGLFHEGFALQFGCERLGASVVPVAAQDVEEQIRMMIDFRVTALAATPSFGLYVAEAIAEQGIDPKQLSLKTGLFSGEPWSEEVRRRLEEGLLIKAYDHYSITEVMGPGVAGECPERSGLHLQEDAFIAEIIDPATGEVLPEGREGELVLTTIAKEAFPLIRFRTGDVTSLTTLPCPCGRTTARIARIRQRVDDTIVVRGVRISPSLIESVIGQGGTEVPHWQVVVDRRDGLDTVTLMLAISETVFFDQMRQQRAFLDDLRERLTQTLGMESEVRLVERRTLQKDFEGKKRIVDLRG
jgi:phenylacetate-CoA ligase